MGAETQHHHTCCTRWQIPEYIRNMPPLPRTLDTKKGQQDNEVLCESWKWVRLPRPVRELESLSQVTQASERRTVTFGLEG